MVKSDLKVGMWVYSPSGAYATIRSNPCQITEIEGDAIWCKDFKGESYLPTEHFLEIYRLANQEEIPVEHRIEQTFFIF